MEILSGLLILAFLVPFIGYAVAVIKDEYEPYDDDETEGI